MSYQVADEIRIVGLQNYNIYEKLNPIEINIDNSEIQENYQDMVPNDINIALLFIVYDLVHPLYKIEM